jgi:hypothetical protein
MVSKIKSTAIAVTNTHTNTNTHTRTHTHTHAHIVYSQGSPEVAQYGTRAITVKTATITPRTGPTYS